MTSKDSHLAETQDGPVRVYVSPKTGSKGNLIAGTSAILAIVGASVLLAGGVWLSLILIINPDSSIWLNRFLPKWTRMQVPAREGIQTLDQIKIELSQKKLIAGQPLFLSSEPTQSDMLLPVLESRPNCQTQCEQIVELRAYQPAGVNKSYQLVSQVNLTEPDDAVVITPPDDDDSENSGSPKSRPLTQVTRFDTKAPGIWLNITGEVRKGETPTVYGQIVHYNPSTTHLDVMLSWINTAGQPPYWQQVTGSGTPELVINQTVDLEPRFHLYQIVPRRFAPNPIDLEEISLRQPAFDSARYVKAVMMARNGLWGTAWKWLRALNKDGLPSNAQAQIDLIELHAQVTESQSKKDWASPSQQVLANIMNGSWSEALGVFQSSGDENRYEIANLLKSDSGRLWNRVEAALKADSSQTDVKAWGALIKSAKKGRSEAIAWVQNQGSTSGEAMKRIAKVVAQLDYAIAEVETANNHLSQIIGAAKPLAQLNQADWQQPEEKPDQATSPLQLEPQQVWYQVQVASFNDGKQWLNSPFSKIDEPILDSPKHLWKLLGLNTDPQILITVWKPDGQRQSAMATVKAMQIKGGGLKLLAAGEVINDVTPKAGAGEPLARLAYTQTAFNVLEPNPITLTDLTQTQPQWVSAILPALWQELQSGGQVKQGRVPSVSVMLQQIGQLLVQPIDLTGNNQPEAVITLPVDASATLKNSLNKPTGSNSKSAKPQTVIFSESGAILYSEFTKDATQTMVGLADMGDGGPAALLINGSSNYSINRWSAKRKRFE